MASSTDSKVELGSGTSVSYIYLCQGSNFTSKI